MYFKRFKKNHTPHLSFSDGLKTLHTCTNISNNYGVWKEEMPWQSGYFIFGSWFSIYIYTLIK